MVVIGAGSGGMAAARRAAGHGAKVAVVERGPLGGTCVNVGCVPKKVMFNAASIRETMAYARDYGYDVDAPGVDGLDWGRLKASRDAFVKRLNGIYARNLDGSNVTTVLGDAQFSAANEVIVDGEKRLTAPHILVATGGYPVVPDIPGAEHAISSDGFFELERQPECVAVVGGGYIAVEMSGIFNALGSRTHTLVRGEKLLRGFDGMVQDGLLEAMRGDSVDVQLGTQVHAVDKRADGLALDLGEGRELVVDELLFATGRRPAVDTLNLDGIGVEQRRGGHIVVDDQQNTNVGGVYAVGDATGHVELTPVAIAAGRLLADRLFAGRADAALDYTNIPSVVFSHPPIGSVGLTEEAAREHHSDVKVYTSTFRNIFYGVCDHKPPTLMKLVCAGPEERVVGLHILGMAADEILQGFGVAVKMGATKADLDSCVAIHPTAAEELVTMAPWNPVP